MRMCGPFARSIANERHRFRVCDTQSVIRRGACAHDSSASRETNRANTTLLRGPLASVVFAWASERDLVCHTVRYPGLSGGFASGGGQDEWWCPVLAQVGLGNWMSGPVR